MSCGHRTIVVDYRRTYCKICGEPLYSFKVRGRRFWAKKVSIEEPEEVELEEEPEDDDVEETEEVLESPGSQSNPETN